MSETKHNPTLRPTTVYSFPMTTYSKYFVVCIVYINRHTIRSVGTSKCLWQMILCLFTSDRKHTSLSSVLVVKGFTESVMTSGVDVRCVLFSLIAEI